MNDTPQSEQVTLRRQFLRYKRMCLRIAMILELIPAVMILVIETANKIYWYKELNKQLSDFVGFDKLVYSLKSDVFIWYLYAIILPFFCLLLLVVLIENRPPMVDRGSVWVILIGVLCPAALLWIVLADSPTANAATSWITIAIFPLNIFLIRNLRQYTRAIGREKRREAEKNAAPADR